MFYSCKFVEFNVNVEVVLVTIMCQVYMKQMKRDESTSI
jgi:hypothetical protein